MFRLNTYYHTVPHEYFELNSHHPSHYLRYLSHFLVQPILNFTVDLLDLCILKHYNHNLSQEMFILLYFRSFIDINFNYLTI